MPDPRDCCAVAVLPGNLPKSDARYSYICTLRAGARRRKEAACVTAGLKFFASISKNSDQALSALSLLMPKAPILFDDDAIAWRESDVGKHDAWRDGVRIR